ncbi:MAG: DEAD/DEAH box helicase [Christensenellaceae bacterium]|jgi:ATP-dependent Lhr-like helicase|nr:DEAD/DEAH box helicase [Christensenellaceae bacterium]
MASEIPGLSRGAADWFARCYGAPTMAQAKSWPLIAEGKNLLLSAPTGSGKTLAAFLVFIDQLRREAEEGLLPDETRLLYLSPLKSLTNDIRQNLNRPLEGLGARGVRAALRNGDTPASERQKMLRRPPHILITTPESLFLLLSSEGGRRILKTLRAVIVDELHALLDGKRGAHLQLSLARLDALCGRRLQRVGLSATVEPLETAAAFLVAPQAVEIVAPAIEKRREIEIRLPVEDFRSLPEGTVWPEIAKEILRRAEGARSILAFTEGRRQSEKLAFHLNDLGGEGFARTHHSCISKEQRLEAETALREGRLRVLCATSSMELGIDVGEIDLVVQLGPPLSAASALQRLGRAGHAPGRVSKMLVLPKTGGEILPCAFLSGLALEGRIERAKPPRKALDVLAQHLVSMAGVSGFHVDEALCLLKNADCFKDVTREELEGVLRMLAGDFEHSLDRPVRPRLLYNRLNGQISGDNYAKRLAVSSGGTIPDRGMFPAVLADGTHLGELEEEFVFEARIGDKFLLGAFAWRIQEVRRDRVVVAPASPEGAQAPFWKGDGKGRAYETGLAFGRKLRALNEAPPQKLPAALAALGLDKGCSREAGGQILRQIELTGCLADDQTILCEHLSDQAGEKQLMLHSVFGRRVNSALEILCQHAAAKGSGGEVRSFGDDDGFLLHALGGGELPEGLLGQIDPSTAAETLRALLPAAPLFSMLFRYNAARALMMGLRGAGRQPLWVQRLRGAEFLGSAIGQEGHPLVAETLRECLEDYLDIPAAIEVLRGVREGRIRLHEVWPSSPSPFSLPLRRQVESTMLYEYNPLPPEAKVAVEAALLQQAVKPGREELAAQSAVSVSPESPERLHALLMAQGDFLAEELDAPLDFLEELLREGRVSYLEPGLWLAKEQEEFYESALQEGNEEAFRRVVRRCLRYRGPQSPNSLSQRYGLPEERCAGALEALSAAREAVREGEEFYHQELYERARRQTLKSRREAVKTLPPEHFAAFMASRLRGSGSAAQQLRAGIQPLLGLALPPTLLEGTLLPARVPNYRPALLDELLAGGEIRWRLLPGSRQLLILEENADVDWEAEPLAEGFDLSEEENTVFRALKARGASFAHALSPLLPGKALLPVLFSLMEKGLAHADHFAPLRQWLAGDESRSLSPRVRALARTQAKISGRWELARPLKALQPDAALERAFARSPLLCRESCEGLAWPIALEFLRALEYTGKVRRGYFVRSLSGAQFIRAEEFAAVTARLSAPSGEMLWLSAADPFQAWGRILPHGEGRAFAALPFSAVALKGGVPVLLFERQGECLRVFDESCLAAGLLAFAAAFEKGLVFPQINRVLVKNPAPEMRPALEAAGFRREGLNLSLWRGV